MSKIDDEFWTRGIEDERKPQSLLELKKEELKDLEDLDNRNGDDFHVDDFHVRIINLRRWSYNSKSKQENFY